MSRRADPREGTPKPCGVMVCGDDPVAVDSTCARIMGLLPEKIDYLARAGTLLGHVSEDKVLQLGESIADTLTPFQVIDAFRHLRRDPTSPLWTANCF